jgi:hypothetical protein
MKLFAQMSKHRHLYLTAATYENSLNILCSTVASLEVRSSDTVAFSTSDCGRRPVVSAIHSRVTMELE